MNMILLISAILLACCVSTNARYNDQFRAGANINNGVPSLSGSWTRTGSNWETSVHGSVSGNGNWGVGVSVGWRFKRGVGSDKPKLYNVSLRVDPCDFITYDVDKDNKIVIGEMHAIFGENKKALNLFLDLDENESGAIEVEEFYEQAPQFIKACADVDKDDDTETVDDTDTVDQD